MNTSAEASIDAPMIANRSTVQNVAELIARILLAAIFLVSGSGKVAAYTATAGYMASQGVPAMLLPLVIATEVLGGLAVVVGWNARIAAFLLAGFSLLTAFIFHSNLADQNQFIHFMKNISMAGGFLLLVVNGPGRLSLDQRRRKHQR